MSFLSPPSYPQRLHTWAAGGRHEGRGRLAALVQLTQQLEGLTSRHHFPSCRGHHVLQGQGRQQRHPFTTLEPRALAEGLQPYDNERYVAALKAKGVPWAADLGQAEAGLPSATA